MVDVGAQRGNTLAGFVQAGWDVVAFEPDPVNLAELKQRFHSVDNLEIHGVAVSDRNADDVEFFGSAQSSGISGLLRFHDTHEVVTHVALRTLRSLLGDLDRPIDFLKIDTEGHDLAVLRGCDLTESPPKLVVAEFDENKALHGGHTLFEIESYLSSNGYSSFVSEWQPIVKYGGNHQWAQLIGDSSQLSDSRAWGNIVASQDIDHLARVRDAIAISVPVADQNARQQELARKVARSIRRTS